MTEDDASFERMMAEIDSGESGRQWIDHFEDYCSSDTLSIDGICRLTKHVPFCRPDDLCNSSFLHEVCMNKKVTVEIIVHLLVKFPQMKHIHQTVHIDTDKVMDIEVDSAYPLHLACFNEDCPNEVIDLLLRKECHYQLTHMCHMDFDWGNTDGACDEYYGTPLHYYLSRTSNVDLDIVKQLVANPGALLQADEVAKLTPIHILIQNKSFGNMTDVLQYLAETNPSSLEAKDMCERTPLNVACSSRHITVEAFKLFLNAGVGVVNEPNEYGEMPLHSLCGQMDIDDEVAIECLKLLLEVSHDSISTQTSTDFDDGDLPLHKAARFRSKAFCKVLVNAYPESVRRQNGYGWLPFHNACYNGRFETVEYLFGLYPESLHIRNNGGYLPIHCAANTPGENTAKIVELIRTHDPECLSKTVVSVNRGDQYHQGNGALPLHITCSHWDQAYSTELIFDFYPEAILTRNEQQQLPIDVLRQRLAILPIDPETGEVYNPEYKQRVQDLISFLSTQMGYATKAQDQRAMRTPDFTGSLPLHNALQTRAPLGSIKLLVKGNPDAVNVPDGHGLLPLDAACQFSTVGVVKYLTQLVPDRLDVCDVNKNYLLHHACRGGNCEVISYLLETPMSSASVSERNVDGMLPIHLFCEFVKGRWCEGETPEYTETIWRLLTAYPETVLNW